MLSWLWYKLTSENFGSETELRNLLAKRASDKGSWHREWYTYVNVSNFPPAVIKRVCWGRNQGRYLYLWSPGLFRNRVRIVEECWSYMLRAEGDC
jgi:hypothetical protein